MKNTISIHTERSADSEPLDMVQFYNEATQDYAFWSNDFNMHFGYFAPLRTNLLKRDTMLNEMNAQVLKRLGLPQHKNNLIVDLGCGMGGTMKYAVQHISNLSALGVTLAEFQVREGNKRLKDLPAAIVQEDFDHTSFASAAFDGAVAIESFCHSGHDRRSFREAHRILRPGGSLVIADAFLKKSPDSLCHGGRYSYQKLCDHWRLKRLGHIEQVVQDLKSVGFSEVYVEDVSFRVAPSVLHVPFAIIGFGLRELFGGRAFKKESLHNLKGSFYALLAGLHMKSFGYYLIKCKK